MHEKVEKVRKVLMTGYTDCEMQKVAFGGAQSYELFRTSAQVQALPHGTTIELSAYVPHVRRLKKPAGAVWAPDNTMPGETCLTLSGQVIARFKAAATTAFGPWINIGGVVTVNIAVPDTEEATAEHLKALIESRLADKGLHDYSWEDDFVAYVVSGFLVDAGYRQQTHSDKDNALRWLKERRNRPDTWRDIRLWGILPRGDSVEIIITDEEG